MSFDRSKYLAALRQQVEANIVNHSLALRACMADMKLAFVIKRLLKEPRFVAGTRRDEVALCSCANGLNIPLEKFIEICFLSMQKIAAKIGL